MAPEDDGGGRGLSADQRHLLEECAVIAALTGIDFWSGLDDPAHADWTTSDLGDSLEMMVRGHIVTEFAFWDEIMNGFVLEFLLGSDDRDELGRFQDPRAELIVHHVLENLYPMQKFALFSAVHNPPAYVKDFMNATNGLRNAFAHTFVLEQRRKPVRYRKHDVLTSDGLRVFRNDSVRVVGYFERSHPQLLH